MKKFINLENLIYATIFLLPSYLIKLNVFGVPTNVLEILILITVAWAFVERGLKILLKPSFRRAIGVILVGLVVSALVNKNYIVGLGIIKGWFILPLLFAVVVKNIIPDEKKKNIYSALYFSGIAVAAIGLAYSFMGLITFDGRLQGFFNSPNYLAMYLAPAIIIGTLNYRRKLLHVLFLIIILSAFYLTYSYAAWAAMIASLSIIRLIKNRTKLSLKQLLIITGVALLIVLSQWNSQKFTDLRQVSERSSVSSRIMIWQSAEKIIKDNWLWGIGPGNFQNKYLEYQKYFPTYLEWAVPHPHNLYLVFWLYTGVIGLCGFVTLLFLWFKEIFRKEKDIIWFMSSAIMLYFLLHGLVDTTYFKNDLSIIFWINFILAL